MTLNELSKSYYEDNAHRMTISLVEAIKICKENGYAVIAREKIKTLESHHRISDRDAFEYRKNPNFIRSIYQRIYDEMAYELSKEGICQLATQESSQPMTTTYRATLTCIPWEVEADPLLEALRKEGGDK